MVHCKVGIGVGEAVVIEFTAGTHIRCPTDNETQLSPGFNCCKPAMVVLNAPAIFVHVSPLNIV